MSNHTNTERVYTDEFGDRYVLDEDGNRRPPRLSKRISRPGKFAEFDTKKGHCGLCGRLTCSGSCFK